MFHIQLFHNFPVLIMLQIVRSFICLIKSHHKALFQDLDFCQTSSQNNVGFRAHNPHYLYAFLAVLAINVYGIFGLVLDAEPDVENLGDILASRYMWMRSIFPRSTWAQTDVGGAIVQCTTLAHFAILYSGQSWNVESMEKSVIYLSTTKKGKEE